ncbi:hypothetical protein L7F22_003973 [Adiantum nelumboides]|nr:hypothetical protein [Adiantum nelumboides]
MYLEVKLAADQPRANPDVAVTLPSSGENGADPFERLHDSVILHILNLVSDIKTLGRCTVVSKRFYALVPIVESVTVKVDCVISGEDNGLNVRAKGIFGHLVRFVVGSLAKPLQALQHMLGPKKAMLASVSHHSPGEVLKNFKVIQRLRIELPGGELGVEDGILLKWKAEFGSTLESCVILGAAAHVKPEVEREKKVSKFEFGRSWFLQGRYDDRLPPETADNVLFPGEDDTGSLPESFYTNGGLKLRVVWTISSLIAASARHYLLQQIICEHPTLQSLILTDTDGQGTLCMRKEQLEEFRHKPLAASASANRTQVPALNMKLWYAPYLELPGGTGLKGATLVAIKPSDQPVRKEVDGFVSGAFEEPFKTAVSLLAKRRTYLLEMNSF